MHEKLNKTSVQIIFWVNKGAIIILSIIVSFLSNTAFVPNVNAFPKPNTVSYNRNSIPHKLMNKVSAPLTTGLFDFWCSAFQRVHEKLELGIHAVLILIVVDSDQADKEMLGFSLQGFSCDGVANVIF